MPEMNKISVFDACVDGQLDVFRQLINPWYDEFNQFYKTYKDTFNGKSESVQNIIFTGNESSISFDVVCSEEITDMKSTKTVSIVKTDNDRYKFTVQHNKAQ